MNKSYFISTLLCAALFASSTHLEKVTVICEDEESIEDENYFLTHTLSHKSKGETLGEYLENSLGYSNSSFGPAVGRPSYHGLGSYRLGINEGTHSMNDLSAQSSDHAVGTITRNQKEIKLLKTTEALLYGAYSGGVVQLLSNQNSDELPKKPFAMRSSIEGGSNGVASVGSLHLEAREGNFALYGDVTTLSSQNFRDGDNNLIKDSDTQADEYRFVLGYQPSNNLTLKLFANKLNKKYGIPNTTSDRTSIDMNKNEVGLVAHIKEATPYNKEIEISLQSSQYEHLELEGSSKDGRFDQDVQSIGIKSDFEFRKSSFTHHIDFSSKKLDVCHIHGKCDSLTTALRTAIPNGESIVNNINTYGYPFSHTNPMPRAKEDNLLNAVNYKVPLTTSELSFSINHLIINVEMDESIIEETYLANAADPDFYNSYTKTSNSAAFSWWQIINDTLSTTVALSSISRAPTSQELLFNGFHHATNNYNLGNRDLENEKSVNLDFDIVAEFETSKIQLNGFYYQFDNYIYQSLIKDEKGNALTDPFHATLVYRASSEEAILYGGGVSYHTSYELNEQKLSLETSFNSLRGKLKNSTNIPQMMPTFANIILTHEVDELKNVLTIKAVDKAKNLAELETQTAGYTMLSLQSSYHDHYKHYNYSIWIKAENLTNVYATNHLSFLKESAPYAGRQIKLGAEVSF
jgi:iron complex outermembrane recepter protein